MAELAKQTFIPVSILKLIIDYYHQEIEYFASSIEYFSLVTVKSCLIHFFSCLERCLICNEHLKILIIIIIKTEVSLIKSRVMFQDNKEFFKTNCNKKVYFLKKENNNFLKKEKN